MYGSLKDYLKSVKTGELPNPQLLLHQDPPIVPPPRTSNANRQVTSGNASTLMSGITSSVYPATNSTLNLCSYHCNQLTQHRQNRTTPYIVPSSISPGGAPINQHEQHHHLYPAASVSLYDTNPASKAHATRLMRLLNSKYYTQQLTDDHEYCHGDTQEFGQLVCSYCGVGEMCVRRACLDDYPYWYHGTMLRNDYYNSYYNYNSKQQKREDSGSPLAKTSGTVHPPQPPPIYVSACEGEGGANSSGYPQQELVCHCESPPNLSPCYDYNQSPSSGCIYCHHYANSEAVAVGGGACQQPTETDRANLGGEGERGLNAAATSSDNTETRLSYFEVLDFALQIARGMEHLEKMKVSHINTCTCSLLLACAA